VSASEQHNGFKRVAEFEQGQNRRCQHSPNYYDVIQADTTTCEYWYWYGQSGNYNCCVSAVYVDVSWFWLESNSYYSHAVSASSQWSRLPVRTSS